MWSRAKNPVQGLVWLQRQHPGVWMHVSLAADIVCAGLGTEHPR